MTLLRISLLNKTFHQGFFLTHLLKTHMKSVSR
ncbi:MAG: hypothetical protein ACE5RF_09335 [Nitrosarchaeum sp.]